MTAEEKSRDRNYRQKYGITLDEYEWRLKMQGGVCACCGNPPKKVRLSVEHDHQWKYVPIRTARNCAGWRSEAMYRNRLVVEYGTKKNEAIRRVRAVLKRLSVRGLVCFPCNGGLRKFGYKAKSLASASKMMGDFYNGIDIELLETARETGHWDLYFSSDYVSRQQVDRSPSNRSRCIE